MRFVLKRKKNNFRVPAVVMAATLAVGALSGCGGEYMGVSGRGGSVSGGAVSGQAINSQKEETPHRYCTDTNLYCEYDDCIVQTRLDGTKSKEIKLKNFEELLCVREGYLYYVADCYVPENDGEDTVELEFYEVCRVPVEKDADGWDVIETGQEEKVISAEEERIVLVWGMNSRYIFYEVGDEGTGDDILIRYDIHSQKKVRLDVISEDKGASYIVTDSYLFARTYGGFFMMGMEGTEWTKVSDSEEPYVCDTEAWDEKAFFYTTPNDKYWKRSTAVRKCDLTDSEDQEFISKKKLRQKAVEAEGIEMDEVDICKVSDLFIERKRLYIQVQLNWRREGVYHIGYLMFSQGEEETELRYEKELTECMKTYGATRKGEWGYEYDTTDGNEVKRKVWEDDVLVNDSCCFGIVNGKAFLWFHNAKKKYGCVGCFELATASFRWLTESDTEYYELLQDDWQDTSEYFYDFDCPPYFSINVKNNVWEPKNERGKFYEDSED